MQRFKQWLPPLLWAALILSSSNDAFGADDSGRWLRWLFGGDVPEAVNFIVRKAAHVVAYGILGALTWRAERRIPLALAFCLAVASADEYSQSLTAGRTGTAWDVMLDLCGAVLAIFAVRMILRRGSGAKETTPSS